MLEEPIVRGNTVELNWRSSESLYFAVGMAVENATENKTFPPQQTTTWKGEVEPNRKYCFDVRGTNGGGVVYKSQPKSINGADCRN